MKKKRRIPAWVLALALTASLGLGTAAILYVGSPEAVGRAIAWRVELYAKKAGGRVPDLSWSELWEMTRTRGGFGLAAVVRDGRSLYGSVVNPHVTDEDRRAGARIFLERCSMCHGSDGSGGHAPPLNRRGLRRGDSDLAIYKVIRDGIPNTSMIAPSLSSLERWQVLGYLRNLQTRAALAGDDGGRRFDIQVSRERLRTAGSRRDEWLTYSGSLNGHRYVSLTEITPANVSRLRVRWVSQFDTRESQIEGTPLVVDGVLFISEPPSGAIALDAASGRPIWIYRRDVPADLPLCCGRVNRGLAILGRVLFLASLDGYLIALDANTGTELWKTRVAKPSAGYTLTGAPLVVDGSVVVGVAGGEYGIRGFLAAYDATTGRERWKFFTIPGPGEPGHETWKNDAWRTGGGPTWVTGAYDPSLDLLYWGVGNPAPDFSGDTRPGDNLFTNSVVALQASSGKLVWHFQFTPHDEHDWDSTQTPILADIKVDGVTRKVICWANRNGFYYVLDRVTGAFLVGTPFVAQDWTKGLDVRGRPIPLATGESRDAGRLTRPGGAGATNWQNPAFDPVRGLVFVPTTDGASVFTKSHNPRRGDHGVFVGSAGTSPSPRILGVRALDAATGARAWEHVAPASNDFVGAFSGLLATRGGLVFGASRGALFALDSATGIELWRVPLGGVTKAAPISFELNGHQVVAVSAGQALFLFGL